MCNGAKSLKFIALKKLCDKNYPYKAVIIVGTTCSVIHNSMYSPHTGIVMRDGRNTLYNNI